MSALLLLSGLALASAPLPPRQRSAPPPQRHSQAGLARIDGRLARRVQDPSLRRVPRPLVVVELDSRADAAPLEALGAEIELVVDTSDGALVQLRADWSTLARLAGAAGVRRVRDPARARPKAVTSEGLDDIFLQDWGAMGLTGAGVTIAVLDVGFSGYESLLGSELPDSVETHLISGWRDSEHGVEVAQVLHDIAPDAALVLYSFSTDVEFLSAASQIAASDADLVNASIGFDNVWHADGTSEWSQAVDRVHDAGIAWFNAAGNESDKYWVGELTDQDGDGWLEFDGEELLRVETDWTSAAEVEVSLRWDEPFGAAGSDLDLYIDSTSYQQGDAPCGLSEDQQDGNDDPYEYAWCQLGDGAKYAYASVFVYDGVGDGRTGWLYSYNRVPEESRTYTQTLTLPADAAGGVAVAAVDWETDTLLDYSSRGPTDDGRDKPDLSGPTEVSTTLGIFTGTSAATPHATAVAALALQSSLFTLDPDALRDWLNGQVTDLGEPGYDWSYGFGYLRLDEPPAPTEGEQTPDTATPSDTGPAPADTGAPPQEGPPLPPLESACACTSGATGPGAGWLVLTLLGLLTRRRDA